jgi:hypothetical protein
MFYRVHLTKGPPSERETLKITENPVNTLLNYLKLYTIFRLIKIYKIFIFDSLYVEQKKDPDRNFLP